ncbi:MAG: hypothetical protein COB22_02345 [Cycloclasticus sp.]|nr:MAG: hypothetical protein COB22_02345 [Cycloclasticus sp.]
MTSIQPKKKKEFGWIPKSPLLLKAMQSNAGILIINWAFQGMRGMQSKELSFRIILELIMGTLFYAMIFGSKLDVGGALLLSLFMAHSVNWLLNTHLWVCIRYMKFYRRDPDALRDFLCRVSGEIERKRWLKEAVCIGSIGDKEDVTSWRSDIDLRLFFKLGLMNYLRLNFYLIYLRTKALFLIIPLDLYAYNDIEYLKNFKKNEGMLLIKDEQGAITQMYPEKLVSTRNE